jgi:uncharacterized membrane protein
MLKRLFRCLHHRWLDGGDVRRCLPKPLVHQLESQVKEGERRHYGEVRLCVEAGLPVRALWSHFWTAKPMAQLARDRAYAVFAKLGVWDTEDNIGVLIYLLLAERRIEIVADRGLNAHVTQAQWQGIIQQLAQPLAVGQFETGLREALADVNALLLQHFPLQAGQRDHNELSDALVIL